jgi:type 1 glutamine amidotransferase
VEVGRSGVEEGVGFAGLRDAACDQQFSEYKRQTG